MMDLELLDNYEHSLVDTYHATEDDFIAQFIAWASMKTDAPEYTLRAAALQALSLSAGDTVVLPPIFGGEGVCMNLFIMMVGPSTVMRKTTVLNFVRGLLPKNQTTGEDYIRFLDDVSIQAFNKVAAKAGGEMSPVMLSVDEVAGLFGLVRKRDSYLSGFDKALMRAYDHSPIAIHRVNATIDADKGAFVNVFAASTPEPLMEVLEATDVESGLLPRFIIFDAREAIRGERRHLRDRMKGKAEFEKREKALQEFLTDIAIGRALGIPDGADPKGRATYPVTMLDITDEAFDRLDLIDARFSSEAGADSTSWGAIKGRAFWHVFKMSGLFALSRAGATAKVELIDVLRACWLVETTVGDLARMTEEVGANAHERQVKGVLTLLEATKSGRMKASSIARQMRFTAKDAREVLGTLVTRDRVVVEKDATGGVYWRRQG